MTDTTFVLGRDVRLGKTPARKGAVAFEFATLTDAAALPHVPKKFGHQSLLPKDIGMLGNDQYGDCVLAGGAHEHMLANLESGHPVEFDDVHVLKDYARVNGNRYPITPGGPDDAGTDMSTAAAYRRKTGLADAKGKRHKIDAYLALQPGNQGQLKQAAYLMTAVGVGIQFPDSAMDQFNEGKPWSVVRGASIEGGHYVPLVGFDGTDFIVLTWGRTQRVTPGFLKEYMDEGIAYVNLETITKNGETLEGFDRAQLEADLKAL